MLNAATNRVDAVRCGFIAGKKVGGAVERNRARRLLREAVRARLPHIKPGWDLVFIARAPIVDVKLDAAGKEMDDLLQRGKLLVPSAETAGAQSRIIGSKGKGDTAPAHALETADQQSIANAQDRPHNTGTSTTDLPETRT